MAFQNFWMGVDGILKLRGLVGDIANPAIMSDELIRSILATTPIARADAVLALPGLLAAEQTRIQGLLDNGPTPADLIAELDDKDRFQAWWNRVPTRTP